MDLLVVEDDTELNMTCDCTKLILAGILKFYKLAKSSFLSITSHFGNLLGNGKRLEGVGLNAGQFMGLNQFLDSNIAIK